MMMYAANRSCALILSAIFSAISIGIRLLAPARMQNLKFQLPKNQETAVHGMLASDV